jgi:UDP-N-acetylmuramate--alanine ligase
MSRFDLSTIQHVHCIGVGGIGVSGIAELLQRLGYSVSGSDARETAITRRLATLGLRIEIGHQSDYLQSSDLVVYSSAIAKDNPERQLAESAGIPLLSRGELLAILMKPYDQRIAVAGTHGKTTTTGLIANTLVHADRDPTYVIGGRLRDQETTIRQGKSSVIVVEADESDGSFLFMRPTIAVITNIEADHLENYDGDFNRLQQSFLDFIAALPDHGVAILGIDCPVIRSLLPRITRPVLTFGFSSEADFRVIDFNIQGLKSQFNLGRPNGLAPLSMTLAMPGQHNILNALAAVVIADLMAIPDDRLQKSLHCFPGMGRRFHPHGHIALSAGSAMLFEDYGHHPSAIAATLAMVKQAWPQRRIVLVFQPHRYSRTRDLIDEFVALLCDVDVLVLLEVYAASETLIPEGSADTLYQALETARQGPTIFMPEFQRVSQRLPAILHSGDIVILQGAGNVGALAQELLGNPS